MLKKIAFLSLATFSCCNVMAAALDPYLMVQDSLSKPQVLTVDLAVDAVNDSIDIFDLREAEGVRSKSAGDYLGFHIAASYALHPQWRLEGKFWQREIEYSQDSNKLQSYLVGIQYQPQWQLDKNDALAFRLSAWGNSADQLSKTSPTQVNSYQFQHVHVNSPEDLQIQLDGIFSRKLDHMNQLNGFVSLGYSQVKVNDLSIQANYQNCLMNIQIQKNNQFKGHLAQPCVKDGITLIELSASGSAEQFGLNMQRDLNYDSTYASIGGSWNWRYRQYASQLAYQYQYLWRDQVDDRVQHFGNQAIRDNHTLGLKLSYDIHPQLTAFLQGEIYQHNLVAYVPFLYNGVTASRLDKRYGLASLGLQFKAF